MTSGSINLTLEKRDTLGKQVRGLRRDGLVPAVIHDHGKPSIPVMANYVDIEKVLRDAGKHHPVDLNVGKENYLALIKDVDVHPTKRTLRHLVFQAIKTDEKVEAEIPIHLEGDAPAEKASLLVLKTLEHVMVEALPRNLPDALTVDATKLVEVGDKLTVADIVAPEGVEIMTEPEQMIAAVEEPKVHEIETPEAEAVEGEEGAAPVEDEAAESESAETPAE